MRSVCAAMAAAFVLMTASLVVAQQPAPTPAPGQPASTTQAPAQPPSTTAGQATPGQPAAPAQAPQPRSFTAPVGLLFNTVRADRVDDFEMAMGYLQAALAASTNERVRAQAAGWRIFKATEAAPGGAVLYVFLLDPTVTGADYSLGRILADAYPDQAKLQEIWKLYSGSVTGGSLLNLTPVKPAPAKPVAPAADTTEKP
ncbi:MAG TPA: hypothetical protein VIR54_18560 [Vicinamibacterales bacterium]